MCAFLELNLVIVEWNQLYWLIPHTWEYRIGWLVLDILKRYKGTGLIFFPIWKCTSSLQYLLVPRLKMSLRNNTVQILMECH